MFKTSLLLVLKTAKGGMNRTQFLINLNVSVQWYLSLRLHWIVNLADCWCTSPETTLTSQPGWLLMHPINQWSWKAWTGKDSVHQQKTTLTRWPSHLLMLQKSNPGTWTLRDMVINDIPYKDHSMLHIGLPHKLWLVPKSPTRGHQIESWLSFTADNS